MSEEWAAKHRALDRVRELEVDLARLRQDLADKDARIAALEAKCERMAKCIEAAKKFRLYRPASHPSDLRNGALRDEWKQLCAAFDAARAAVEEGSR